MMQQALHAIGMYWLPEWRAAMGKPLHDEFGRVRKDHHCFRYWLPDATGAVRSLAWCQQQMPGARALLCSPLASADLPASIEWRAVPR
jgi:hypothetical protein